MAYDLVSELKNAKQARLWLRIPFWFISAYLVLCLLSVLFHSLFEWSAIYWRQIAQPIAYSVDNNLYFIGNFWHMVSTKADPTNAFWIITKNRWPVIAAVAWVALSYYLWKKTQFIKRLERNEVDWEDEQYRKSLNRPRPR